MEARVEGGRLAICSTTVLCRPPIFDAHARYLQASCMLLYNLLLLLYNLFYWRFFIDGATTTMFALFFPNSLNL
jgi:hypothetical protein